ncbi:MAG: hypothetical protein HY934_01075 [Candidatus Firestonebacteria bacterium]|nr:hypothetical protein [Candidatus Firestonebacteria bacterium]
MKKQIVKIVCFVFILAFISVDTVLADNPREIGEINLSGPRIGYTIMNDKLKIKLKKDRDIETSNAVVQFGWQFEKRISPKGKDIVFVTELIPLIGGIDQSILLPSITGIIGFRTKTGTEFGLGPYVSPGGTTIVYSAGVTFQYGGMNIPLNFAVAPFTDGTSFNILTGFNW